MTAKAKVYPINRGRKKNNKRFNGVRVTVNGLSVPYEDLIEMNNQFAPWTSKPKRERIWPTGETIGQRKRLRRAAQQTGQSMAWHKRLALQLYLDALGV